MKPIGTHNYFIYMLTNVHRSVLYIGVTNDLYTRIKQHEEESKNPNTTSFAGKYNCVYLVYYERFDFIQDAIDREKEIKKWSRKKKDLLIATLNPNWDFLNSQVDLCSCHFERSEKSRPLMSFRTK